MHLNIQRFCAGCLCEWWVCALRSASLWIVDAVRETFCYKVMFELVSLLCLLQIFCSFSTSGVKRLVWLRKDVNVKLNAFSPPFCVVKCLRMSMQAARQGCVFWGGGGSHY